MTITDELKRVGAVLVRKRKHQVWRLPTGGTFICSSSPSDHRALRNQLASLRREMRKTEHG